MRVLAKRGSERGQIIERLLSFIAWILGIKLHLGIPALMRGSLAGRLKVDQVSILGICGKKIELAEIDRKVSNFSGSFSSPCFIQIHDEVVLERKKRFLSLR